MSKQNASPEVLILGGIPASGKSTFRVTFLAENPDYVAISRDDFRYMLRNVGWEPSIEKMVTQLVNQSISNAILNGRSVLIDATHCTEKSLNGYSWIKDTYPVKLRYKYFDIDPELAIERDSRRERSVGREVIESMYTNLEALKKTPKWITMTNPALAAAAGDFQPVVQDPKLPMTVLFDIDGTLARIRPERGRSPFHWHRVGEDLVVGEVVHVLNMYRENGYKVVIMSGRDSICRPETEKWLKDNLIQYDDLLMRPEGNSSKDSLVKYALLNEYVLPKYYVDVVYDDRQQVVDMWRQIGLTCFQVAEGNF